MTPTVSMSPEIIRKAIDELREISEKETRIYLEKLIDFLKWTTTIALGAFFWIGTNYHSISNGFWVNISLASFGVSIILSFAFIIFILNWMNSESKLIIDQQESLKSIIPGAPFIPGAPLTDEASKAQNKVITRLSERYSQLSRNLEVYKYLIAFHGLCLIGGTIFSVMAISLN